MLQPMQPSGQAIPSPSSQSFAGLLASFASPEPDAKDRAAELSIDDLGEDVVALSYERALRTHARYKPTDAIDRPLPETTDRKPSNALGAVPPTNAIGAESLSAEASETLTSVDGPGLRSRSVTIRLSSAESARLHRRAAEAGVTVSAYLRSCTFEADALRAQVKAALAELRAATPDGKQAATAPVRHSRFGWMVRLLKRESSTEPVGHA